MKTRNLTCILMIAGVMLAGPAVLGQDNEEETGARKLNLNIATLEELLELPGITDDMAQTIFEHRPYESFLNVMELEGISEEFLVSIEDIAEVALLNINTATSEELQRLPGMTPELADAIIANGPYKVIEELYKVKGIGEEEFAKLAGYIAASPEDAGDKGWKPRKVLLSPQP